MCSMWTPLGKNRLIELSKYSPFLLRKEVTKKWRWQDQTDLSTFKMLKRKKCFGQSSRIVKRHFWIYSHDYKCNFGNLLSSPCKAAGRGGLWFINICWTIYYSCLLSLPSVTNNGARTRAVFQRNICNFVAHSLLRTFGDPVASCNILQHISSAFYNSKRHNVVSRLRILTQAELMLEMNQRLLWASLWMNSKSTFACVKTSLPAKLFIWICRSRVRLFPCNWSHLHMKRFARGLYNRGKRKLRSGLLD